MSVGVFLGSSAVGAAGWAVFVGHSGGSALLGLCVSPFGNGGFHSKFAVLYLKIAGCPFGFRGDMRVSYERFL